jgi:hypothetical protein
MGRVEEKHTSYKMSVMGIDTKTDSLGKAVKMLTEEQGRVKNHVGIWEENGKTVQEL